jgi:hypothetical protein
MIQLSYYTQNTLKSIARQYKAACSHQAYKKTATSAAIKSLKDLGKHELLSHETVAKAKQSLSEARQKLASERKVLIESQISLLKDDKEFLTVEECETLRLRFDGIQKAHRDICLQIYQNLKAQKALSALPVDLCSEAIYDAIKAQESKEEKAKHEAAKIYESFKLVLG